MTSKRKIAACVIILKMLERKKTRSVWIRDWILKRERYGACSQLMSELYIEDPAQFSNFLRVNPTNFEKLICRIGPLVSKQDTRFRKAIDVTTRLAVTLRFLATGDSYASLSYLFRVPKCTISIIVPEVCRAIYSALKDDYIKVPSTSDDWNNIALKFHSKWNFPKCLGAIDGKHILVQAPEHSGSYYYNYKGQHSIVLMASVDAEYKFTIITVGSNGRVSDGGVFRATGVADYIKNAVVGLEKMPLPGRTLYVPYVFVSDDAFPLQPHIMKPYPFNCQGSMRIFNYRLSRARRIVENAFGIMSSVFRVLRKPLLITPERVEAIVLATCTLHNFLLSGKSATNVYAPEGTFDREASETGEIIQGTWRSENMPADNLFHWHNKAAIITRTMLKKYGKSLESIL
ncbi:uncharacterized protein LOC129771282 [Toxorhynchites rutilus septentrionalis]|uniref:uncharacterized protein LOC129771282 n=1 Tax=Toxorhynchites rutilus septentrionalis TaxID=329112 RepID=UPI002479988E|nr:uncharacterized protein LOC129771282 [Toxorhynchites rutilus septentrionalis]